MRAHRTEGVQVGRKRVARLMRAAGLQGVSHRKRVTTTQRDPAEQPAPDLVERAFVAPGPNHGCQYTSVTFGLRCQEAGVRPSMGSVDDAFDNALCESFFATQAEARLEVFDFSEGWYNPHRRHSALDYESPLSHERKHQPAA